MKSVKKWSRLLIEDITYDTLYNPPLRFNKALKVLIVSEIHRRKTLVELVLSIPLTKPKIKHIARSRHVRWTPFIHNDLTLEYDIIIVDLYQWDRDSIESYIKDKVQGRTRILYFLHDEQKRETGFI